MSLCHLDSYVWVVCLWKRFFQNVHFLCMWLMSADELLGIRKSGKLGEIKNILRLQKLSGSLECESSEDFWAAVLFHLGGVLPDRVRYVLHTVRLARQVLGLCLQTFPLQISTKYFFATASMPDVESQVLSKYKNLLQQLVRNLSEESVNIVAAFGWSLQKIHPMPAKILWLFVINVF